MSLKKRTTAGKACAREAGLHVVTVASAVSQRLAQAGGGWGRFCRRGR